MPVALNVSIQLLPKGKINAPISYVDLDLRRFYMNHRSAASAHILAGEPARIECIAFTK
jgi:hypothetical protein